MRPPLLDPLFAGVDTLPGVGPKLSKLLNQLVVPTGAERSARIADLLFHVPNGVIDRSFMPGVASAPEGAIVTVRIQIDRHLAPPPGNRRVPYRVEGHDGTGSITLVYFGGRYQHLSELLPVGEERYVSGKVERFNGAAQIVHPDYVVSQDKLETLPRFEAIYPSTAGLTRKVLRKTIASALACMPTLPEWIDGSVLSSRSFPAFKDALRLTHHDEERSLAERDAGTARLAYDELFAGQLALALVRQSVKRQKRPPRRHNGRYGRRVRDALPFALTNGQENAVRDVLSDMSSETRMLRLLQGDVGSGKTVVALLAACAVVEDGGQCAVMAPTEVLARQHFATMKPLCDAAGLSCRILTGRDRGAERKQALEDLRGGRAHIGIGTHALFQAGVAFANLGLVVVDEQHRFGVQQRLALAAKGNKTDVLVMTATPIPRTLVMTHFGDMDVSTIREKPVGRKPIDTRVISLDNLDALIERTRAALQRGEKLYWVCPLVEANDELPATSAEDRFDSLRKRFGDTVGLVHGRMKGAEKDAAIADFRDGRTRLLVATTVVEVGVDVPDASIIVIENAERFGLSQLHQLRGRVGRGDAASTCILLYRGPLGESAQARLNVLRETEDGFRIAEEDLRLRGEGELLGTRQSGEAGFRLAGDIARTELMPVARDDARLLLTNDPILATERGEAARHALYLFGQDDAIKLLRAG